MIQTSMTNAATPGLSAACKDLAAETENDAAFLSFINNKSIVSRIYHLVYNQCDKIQAVQINQLIISNAKPDTPSLIQARQSLISATTYCQIPESASPGRTEADMEKFVGNMDEFRDILTSCREPGKNVSSLQKILDSGEIIRLRGNGNDAVLFTVTGDGLRIITLQNTGDRTFIVWLMDDKGNPVDMLVNDIGPYAGKTSEKLEKGTYFVDITAYGPWAISVISI